ncbi:hypothetical protein GCM10007426_41740 [Alloalcanivorax dieselolei]|nr:hypothetical protein GCM10007426_41740 [Alloalcanivorax dieselolei]
MNCRVAVVIPAHNECVRLVEAVKSIVDFNQAKAKFYIVDDASSDGTKEAIESYLKENNIPHQVSRNEAGKGAGFCRNIAFANVTEEYVLFLDADDFLYPGMLDKAVERANESGAQVVLTEYERVHDANDKKLGMNPLDEGILSRLTSAFGQSAFAMKDAAYALEIANYPWNKLQRTDYCKEIGLRFSSTPVHNDVFAHWLILMNATRVAVLNASFCGHRVSLYSNQITNIADERRMAMLDVFAELDDYFVRHPELKEHFYHIYTSFKIRLFHWGMSKIDNAHQEMFKDGFCRTLESMTSRDFFDLSKKVPNIALDVLRYRMRQM